MASDLSELQEEMIERGYTRDFGSYVTSSHTTTESLRLDELRIVDSVSFDGGTDPGDDVTTYLIESSQGHMGYLILSDSFHADPQKVAFINLLLANSGAKDRSGS